MHISPSFSIISPPQINSSFEQFQASPIGLTRTSQIKKERTKLDETCASIRAHYTHSKRVSHGLGSSVYVPRRHPIHAAVISDNDRLVPQQSPLLNTCVCAHAGHRRDGTYYILYIYTSTSRNSYPFLVSIRSVFPFLDFVSDKLHVVRSFRTLFRARRWFVARS